MLLEVSSAEKSRRQCHKDMNEIYDCNVSVRDQHFFAQNHKILIEIRQNLSKWYGNVWFTLKLDDVWTQKKISMNQIENDTKN